MAILVVSILYVDSHNTDSRYVDSHNVDSRFTDSLYASSPYLDLLYADSLLSLLRTVCFYLSTNTNLGKTCVCFSLE